MPELSMDDRYGRRPPRYKGLAITLLIIGGSWLAWAGLHHSNPEIRTNLISFSVVSDRSISLRYSRWLPTILIKTSSGKSTMSSLRVRPMLKRPPSSLPEIRL